MDSTIQIRREIHSYLPGGKLVFAVFFSVFSMSASAQEPGEVKPGSPASADTSAKKMLIPVILKKLTVSGTIRMRYTASFDKDIDINGNQSTTRSVPFTNNSFTIPQARIVVTGDITKKMNVYMRFNFGDFAGNPQSHVLEYAYGTYNFNQYLNLRAGLLRPFFGREDDISTDFLKSFDYSLQYTAFGDNGWVGYQMGATLFGTVNVGETPLKYYAGVFNGNGRNNFTDNDNGKIFPLRLDATFAKKLTIGLNGGLGRQTGHHLSAWGGDINFQQNAGERWQLELEGEFKQGNNQTLFFSQAIPGKKVGDYIMRGAYILPSIQYKLKQQNGASLEASFKYEYLDPDIKQNGNRHQQYVPMVGMDFVELFAIRLQMGVVVDRYKRNIENSPSYNSGRFITQLQLRF